MPKGSSAIDPKSPRLFKKRFARIRGGLYNIVVVGEKSKAVFKHDDDRIFIHMCVHLGKGNDMPNIQLSNLNGDEQAFLRRLEDICQPTSGPRFTHFLTPRQLQIAQSFVAQRKLGDTARFYGGYPDAERQMAGFFPDFMEPEDRQFPLQAVTAYYRRQDALSHRDFLGACMSLSVSREHVGDMIPGQGRCVLFLHSRVADVVLNELEKVGRVGVRVEAGAQGEVERRQEVQPLCSTISSPRLDCMVAAATGRSREKSARLIESELVRLNYVVIPSVSQEVNPGDVLSIRGHGKFLVHKIGAPTRKGRLPVEIHQYR